jgi:RNA polymerase sigma factor (sigma-70 family)
MQLDESVTQWITALRAGDEEAARQLWLRYFEKIADLARYRFQGSPRRVADEEDIALSVFQYLCEGAQRGDWGQLNDRDQLWRLLVTVTIHKVIDQRRQDNSQKRGGGKVRGGSVFLGGADDSSEQGFDGVTGDDSAPDFLAQVAEQHDRLLDQLQDETLRSIVLWKVEGMNNEEIAARLGITSRSVRRKVERIREIWQDELST